MIYEFGVVVILVKNLLKRLKIKKKSARNFLKLVLNLPKT